MTFSEKLKDLILLISDKVSLLLNINRKNIGTTQPEHLKKKHAKGLSDSVVNYCY